MHLKYRSVAIATNAVHHEEQEKENDKDKEKDEDKEVV